MGQEALVKSRLANLITTYLQLNNPVCESGNGAATIRAYFEIFGDT